MIKDIDESSVGVDEGGESGVILVLSIESFKSIDFMYSIDFSYRVAGVVGWADRNAVWPYQGWGRAAGLHPALAQVPQTRGCGVVQIVAMAAFIKPVQGRVAIRTRARWHRVRFAALKAVCAPTMDARRPP
ncbi:MAG TPA: hypothetical protein VFS82_10885 [Lysobacter sp.]|nr:hypothetical protein [Lysobacter sp.]